jgi:hypothetical protein
VELRGQSRPQSKGNQHLFIRIKGAETHLILEEFQLRVDDAVLALGRFVGKNPSPILFLLKVYLHGHPQKKTGRTPRGSTTW